MGERTVVTVTDGPVTRLGQIVLAGEVRDDEPIMPSTLRVLDAYVLSVLIDGEGNYRDADGRAERIRPGAHTILPPPGDRTHSRLRRRVPPVAPVPGALRRPTPRLPPRLRSGQEDYLAGG
ncbi:hypothetical protein ACWGID_34940 [Kribbella sp. NPDC054772]